MNEKCCSSEREISLNCYQLMAMKTKAESVSKKDLLSLFYAMSGLTSEVGELANLVKRSIMSKGSVELASASLVSELGDILWYLTSIAEHFNIDMGFIAEFNLEKLRERQAKGLLFSPSERGPGE